MGSYLLVFVIAAVIAALWTPGLKAIGRRIGAVDTTRDPPVPRMGGWSVFLGLIISLALVGIVFQPSGHTLLGAPDRIGPVFLGALAMLVIGTVDDIAPLRAVTKLILEVVVAVAAYWLGVRIELVSGLGGSLALGPAFSAIATVIWLVGIANAFNLLDGADGVAAGSAFFAAAAVFMMSVRLGHPAIGLVASALAGGLLGFLPFNFPPARVFLGDSGSLVAGFMLAGLAVEGSTKAPTLVAIAVPLVAFAVPVFDTTITLIRRTVRGQPIFQPDHGHLHHRLAHVGLSPRQVAAFVYAVSAGVALLAMLFLNPNARSIAVVLIIFGVGIFLVARFLHLHELNELGRLAKRGALQPKAIAVNVSLRHAAERLERATTLGDIRDALAVLFERSEFDEVLIIASPMDDRRGGSRAWVLRDGRFVEEWPRRRPDEWEVTCPFHGNGWNGELRLRRRLGRRSLLLDLNLLLELVQPALNAAASRIEAVAADVA